MKNKKIIALAAAIAFSVCGCIQTGADVVIDVDGYGGIAFMMEQSAVSAAPIPIEPIYSDTGDTPDETTGAEITDNTDQSSSEQTAFPVQDDEPDEKAWEETPFNATMYVNTEGVCSRAKAIMGSEKANRFGLNQEVTVIAKTNTYYYKLENETYIHMDYLSAEYVTVSTTVTTAEPKTDPPETTPRETEPPVTAAPVTTAPETAPPVTAAPETTPPVTAAPETTPPITVPPETQPPATETEAPETTAAETPNQVIFDFQSPFILEELPDILYNYPAKSLKNETKTYLKGIDVSWAQGEIDWEAVSRSGIDFAYIRAGRGDIDGSGPKADKYFLQNIRGANKYGIDVGVYFYSYALTEEDARAEARLTLDLISGYTVTYPVVYDLEEWMDRSNLADIAKAYMDTIAEGGYYPMLYSFRYGVDGNFSKDFTDTYAIWVAQRSNNRPETDYDYYIWQYSFTGKVDGIKGDVDLDISYLDFPEIFRRYGINNLSIFS